MNIDMQTELFAMGHQLADMIDQEHDQTAHDALVEAFDAVGATLQRLNDKANDEFQDDTPPNAPK